MIRSFIFLPAVRLQPIPDVVDLLEVRLLVGLQLFVLSVAAAEFSTAPLVHHCDDVLVFIVLADDLVILLLQVLQTLVARSELCVTSAACRLLSGDRFYPRSTALDDVNVVGVDILVDDLVDVRSQLRVAFLVIYVYT